MAHPIYPTPFRTASELINDLDFLDTLNDSKIVEVIDKTKIAIQTVTGRLVSGPKPNFMLKLWTIELSQTGGAEISNTFLFTGESDLLFRVLAANVNDYIRSHLNEIPSDIFNIIASYYA